MTEAERKALIEKVAKAFHNNDCPYRIDDSFHWGDWLEDAGAAIDAILEDHEIVKRGSVPSWMIEAGPIHAGGHDCRTTLCSTLYRRRGDDD